MEEDSAKRRKREPSRRKKDGPDSESPGIGAPEPIAVPRIRPPPLQAQVRLTTPRPPPLIPYTDASDENPRAFFTTEDHAFNKRGFRYVQCAANPSLSSVLYQIAEVPPYHARISTEDRSPQVFVTENYLTATSNQGFRSCRANVGIREGKWYLEFKIHRANDGSGSHVRLGLARRESSLEAPVGHDAYSYSVRDVSGEKVHASRPAEFMKEGFKTGDVIGLYVNIPRAPLSERCIDVARDRIPIQYKGHLFFETLDYVPTKPMEELMLPKTMYNKKRKESDRFEPATIPGSFIRFYKNGKDMGVAFEDLKEFLPPWSKYQKLLSARDSADDGLVGYYPMISMFKGGTAEFNFGPQFEYPPKGLAEELASGSIRSLAERYDEQIADDVTFDLLDQVDYEIIDKALDEAEAKRVLATGRSQLQAPTKIEEIAPGSTPEIEGQISTSTTAPLAQIGTPNGDAPPVPTPALSTSVDAMPVDVPEDVLVDVPVDVPADVPVDVPADVPVDVPADVPESEPKRLSIASLMD